MKKRKRIKAKRTVKRNLDYAYIWAPESDGRQVVICIGGTLETDDQNQNISGLVRYSQKEAVQHALQVLLASLKVRS